ncbi:hypothetical protein CU097_006205 [Rhizopus azygosporus]|uniref:Uncharacterized protein n=1 Tax=Rhizopus azygosporus TaxID=86630 RepID=A0A367JUK1_RHIAZ|nr:hypothetical protein CU097_006205 [Rhizopus azygosporus]
MKGLQLKNPFLNKRKQKPEASLTRCKQFKSMVHLPSETSLVSYSTTTTMNSNNINTGQSMDDQSYSNFYLKLPNGNWMVYYRTRDRKMINSFELKGDLI